LQRILLNISGVLVDVESEWGELLNILTKDFWSFKLANESILLKKLKIVKVKIYKTDKIPAMPMLVASMQTNNAVTYDLNGKRFCDYYGAAYTDIDFKEDISNIYGSDFDRVHEVAYLLILSRVGKKLDLQGLHKLHAFAISFEGIAFVCMMPSKGGKSTLLIELLKDSRVKMISDDIPLIDSRGRVHSFPLKIGLNEKPKNLAIESEVENVYTMKRALYGEKFLICTQGIAKKVEPVGMVFNKIILAEAFRYNSVDSIILKSSWFKSAKGLFKHGILALGSPMILEYFWQSGLNDFLIKSKIFLLRIIAFGALCVRARKIKIYSGIRPDETAREILNFLERKKNFF